MPVKATHWRFVPQAIAGWQARSWPNSRQCELLVVCAPNDPAPDHCPDGVEYIVAPQGMTLGERRNFAIELASGEFIAHFDADDWYHPSYLAWHHTFYGVGGKGKAQVIGHRSCMFYDEDERSTWRFRDPGPVVNIGASLFYRREWALKHPFPRLSSSEDFRFVRDAAAAGVLMLTEGDGLMVARSHRDNTSKRNYSAGEGVWQRASLEDLPAGFRATLANEVPMRG